MSIWQHQKEEMVATEDIYGGEEVSLVQPDPVGLQIDRLQNQLTGSYHITSLLYYFLCFRIITFKLAFHSLFRFLHVKHQWD